MKRLLLVVVMAFVGFAPCAHADSIATTCYGPKVGASQCARLYPTDVGQKWRRSPACRSHARASPYPQPI
jgi:hypothetical protein